jgi:Zn-dependent peptidase ImmA (M78 family)
MQEEATRAADRVLDGTWPGGREDPAVPVDPAQIARKLGIDVYETELETDVFALLAKQPGEDPVIALNQADSRNRKRFSCAHELGHFVRRSDSHAGLDQYAYLDRRSSLSASGSDADEVYANAFAASLLMPEICVRRYRRAGLQPLEMGLRFDVSQEAMQYRLKNLRLL